MVLALEEWIHRQRPLPVWTDHKNLAYLNSAKILNSHQARWVLFQIQLTSPTSCLLCCICVLR